MCTSCCSASHLDLRVVPFDDHDAAEIVAEADAFNALLYGHVDATAIQPAEFDLSNHGVFLVAYRTSEPWGCGGYRRVDHDRTGMTAEIKRLYVRPLARRSGVARSILSELEARARDIGFTRLILDVGRKQPAAHTLYEAMGYKRIPGFSIYRDKPGNRAYGKSL